MSTLASMIRKPTWPQIDQDLPLARFHKKFWGTSMTDDEAKWRKTQHGGEHAHDDVDDDCIPGCHALAIGITGMRPRALWIRADYIRMYDFFQAYYDEYAAFPHQAPSAVLTGQPGIGKSYWVYYAARRRAAERKPFVWLFRGEYHLFVQEGVYALPADWQHTDFRRLVWAFVDSDESKDAPERLLPHDTHFFVIYVASPDARRWSRMEKTTLNIVTIMNPWGRDEMQRAALLSRRRTTRTHVNETFDLLGPVPRLCVDYSSPQLTKYKNAVDKAISRITVDQIQRLAQRADELSLDAVSERLFLLSRECRDDVCSDAVVAPITHAIQSRLANRFRDLQVGEHYWLPEGREPLESTVL